MSFLSRIVSPLSAYASIFGLYFYVFPIELAKPVWHWVVLCFAILVAIFNVYSDIKLHIRERPKRCKSTRSINAYMEKWIRSGSQVVVFSRDLSWSSDPKIKSLLMQKSSAREITIYLEHMTDDAKLLLDAGANIMLYRESGHVPRSRFTIVDYGLEGARVAIGLKVEGVHTIHEFQSGRDPMFAVAEDMIRFLSTYASRV